MYTSLRDNRIGVSKMQNCGMIATCIEYRTSQDADFKFIDGTIVTNKYWIHFERGGLLNPKLREEFYKKTQEVKRQTIEKKYLGKVYKTGYGMTYKVIKYMSKNECIIEFNDGYQMNVQVQRLGSSIKREDLVIRSKNGICHTIEIGDTRIMNCGMKATIIRASSSNDIDVKFENGVIKEHVRFSAFEKGKISPKIGYRQKHFVGDKYITSEGEEITLVDMHGVKGKGIVEFSDGTRRDVELKRLKDGVNLPKIKVSFKDDKTIGKWFETACGLKCKVLRWIRKNTVDVEFEEGTVKQEVNIQALKKGQVSHPDLSKATGYNMFYGFKVKRFMVISGKLYYTINDDKNEVLGIATIQEIIAMKKV